MKQSISQRELLTRAAKYYYHAIDQAEDYLEERGIPLELARQARLGVVVDPFTGHENYQGRLSIPYITRSGVVDLRFRSLDGQDPKYMGLPGATTHLYNVSSFFHAHDYIAVCEGEIDTLTLSLCCNIPAVGVPGVNNWKKHYNRLLQDFETVYVFSDGDQPGMDFAKSLVRELSNVTIIQMPDGEDVNSMFKKHGASYFHAKLEEKI